jgi:hypothetical protein
MRAEAITVAAENRSASAFLFNRGMKDMDQILRVMRGGPNKSS